MKICPTCGAQLEDTAAFCNVCGTSLAAVQPVAPAQETPAAPAAPAAPAEPVKDPYDHTDEFEAEDISNHKPYAMLLYLVSIIGLFAALIAGKDSPYLKFHTRQIIKFMVLEALVGLAAAVLCWTFIVPIAAVVAEGIMLVLKVIAFFQICAGKSKEPAIIRNFGFLK